MVLLIYSEFDGKNNLNLDVERNIIKVAWSERTNKYPVEKIMTESNKKYNEKDSIVVKMDIELYYTSWIKLWRQNFASERI